MALSAAPDLPIVRLLPPFREAVLNCQNGWRKPLLERGEQGDLMRKTEQFLPRVQAAKVLGRCPKTLRSLQEKGLGPTVMMVGYRPAYPVADLQRWLSDNTFGGGA
jgi:hypothetical protein